MEPYITFEGYRIASSAIEYVTPAIKLGDGYIVEFHMKSGRCISVPLTDDNEEDAMKSVDELDDLILDGYAELRGCFIMDINGTISDLVAQVKEGWNA
jgi:hypothetical protein